MIKDLVSDIYYLVFIVMVFVWYIFDFICFINILIYLGWIFYWVDFLEYGYLEGRFSLVDEGYMVGLKVLWM